MAPADPDSQSSPTGGGRGGVSRRTFLRRGALTAAAVGVVGSVPGLSGFLVGGAAEAPALETGATEAEGGAMAEPLLAQIKDVNTGEISLFQGEREIVIHDSTIARSLANAAHR
jgi:hypothetical protein